MKLKTIDKFVLKAYIGPMFATFFIVMFILMMNALWLFIDEIVGRGLPFSAIVKLVFFFSSTMIPLGLPLATLLAALMTMGNMGENYELTALKAAGISLFRIIRSILVLAMVISVASFFVINNYVPYSFSQMGKVLSDIRSQREEIEFIDGAFFNGIPNVSIRVDKQDKKTKMLDNVLIYDNRDRNVSKTIVANTGYIAISEDKSFMTIELYDGQNIEDNRNNQWINKPTFRSNSFTYQLITLELSGFNFEEGSANPYAEQSDAKNIAELQKNIDSLAGVSQTRIDNFEVGFVNEHIFSEDKGLSIKSALDTVAVEKSENDSKVVREKFRFSRDAIDTMSIAQKKSFYDVAATSLQNMQYYTESKHAQITGSTVNLYRSKADWHKKLALPVSVFIFFLIGAPLGAIIRRGGLGLPVVISVLFFLLYYVMTLSGDRFVKEGLWSPISGMWLSSFVLGPIAIFLTYKAVKDSQLMSSEAYFNVYKKIKTKIKNKYKNAK